MSPRAALLGFVVALVVGLGVLAVAGSRADSPDTATLGNFPVQPLAVLQGADDRVCQRPVALPDGADRVRLTVAPGFKVRGPVRVSVNRLTAAGEPGAELTDSVLPRGRLAGEPTVFALRRSVRSDAAVAVCVTQSGPEPVQIWGQANGTGSMTPSTSDAYLDGKTLNGDLYLRFPRATPSSNLDQVPAAFRHAAPFKLGGMGAWTFWALALLLLAAALGLGAAVASAAREAHRDVSPPR